MLRRSPKKHTKTNASSQPRAVQSMFSHTQLLEDLPPQLLCALHSGAGEPMTGLGLAVWNCGTVSGLRRKQCPAPDATRAEMGLDN